MRRSIMLAAAAGLLAGGAAWAQSGETSGPATGGNVAPSTAIQKEESGAAPNAAGQPGVEGRPGVEGGRSVETGAPEQPTPDQPANQNK